MNKLAERPGPIVVRLEMDSNTFWNKIWSLAATTLLTLAAINFTYYGYKQYILSIAVRDAQDPIAVSCAIDEGNIYKNILCASHGKKD